MFKLLGSNRRNKARSIARDEYMYHHATSEGADQAKASASDRIRAEYGSIIGMIIASIMIKLAVALITKWVEDKMLIPPNSFQPGEPGFYK